MAYALLRPLLHRIDPERAHALSLAALRLVGALPPLGALVRRGLAPPRGREVSAFGLRFPNAVGLAAGYDKDGLGWRGLSCLGFGHIEVGTVTPRPQPGNERPRIFRLKVERSLINRLGFPSRGAAFVEGRLTPRRTGGPVVGVNLGKQRETSLGDAVGDYEALMERFAPLADYLVINISSPNTPGLRRLQQRDWLEPLLTRLVARKRVLDVGLPRPCPLLVKLSPDLAEDELDQALEALLTAEVDGVIATNTTLSRDGALSPAASEAGGLSGALLTERSTEVVRRIRSKVSETRLPIIACGGVMNPDDARSKLDAGACLVQIYTGLVYAGPGLVRRIVAAT